MFFQNVNLNEMVMCLEDLINYFAQPEDDMGKKIYFFKNVSLKCFYVINNKIFQNTKRSRTNFELLETVRISFKRKAY